MTPIRFAATPARRQQRPRWPLRSASRAFALFDLLVALALAAVILPMAGVAISLLLKANAKTAGSLAEAMTLDRFSRTLRADLHSARKADAAKKGPNPDELTLLLDRSRQVRYLAKPDGTIERRVLQGGTAVRREEFRLRDMTVRFETAADGKSAAATCLQRIDNAPRTAGGSRPPAAVRVEATVGRDLRFQTGASAAKGSAP